MCYQKARKEGRKKGIERKGRREGGKEKWETIIKEKAVIFSCFAGINEGKLMKICDQSMLYVNMP